MRGNAGPHGSCAVEVHVSFSFHKGGRWVLFALLSFGGISCSSDPESFCASKVEQICKVLADCCNGSAEFDMEGCELQVSTGCSGQLAVEGVHAGDYVFDEGAANSCYGALDSCEAITDPPPPDKDQIKACGNAITGHRPPGSACTDSKQCEKAGGDYPSCHGGQICAKAILSEEECSFSFETNELRVCVPGMYCDVPEETPDPDVSPTKQALEFSGTCKSPLGQGKKCIPDGMKLLPCKEGLTCQFDPMDIENSTCQPLKSEGAACTQSAECKDGLFCEFNGMETVCTKNTGTTNDPGLFCFQPPDCGNGDCEEPYEDGENCAVDCAESNCGNGDCEVPFEDATSCPEDCANSNCGDGVCDFNGTEPATCPQDCCGDGFCDPGETPEICAADCSP